MFLHQLCETGAKIKKNTIKSFLNLFNIEATLKLINANRFSSNRTVDKNSGLIF